MKKSFCLAVVLMVWSQTLPAGYNAYWYGPGSDSCGTYIKSADDPVDRLQFRQYTAGYLSGAGAYNNYDMQDPDYDGWSVWLTNFCNKNPLTVFGLAVNELHMELKRRNPGG